MLPSKSTINLRRWVKDSDQPFAQPVEHPQTGIELINRHVFIRLVRLPDGSRPANYNVDPVVLKQARFGTE